MSGFQGYFRDKILSAIPHIMVMDYSGNGVQDEKALQKQIEQVPHVQATTPFTISQAMLTSKDRVQGVVVRGINPGTEGNVTKLGKNMVEGSLGDLEAKGPKTARHYYRRGSGTQVRRRYRRYDNHGKSHRARKRQWGWFPK